MGLEDLDIKESVLDLIGNTPMVRLARIDAEFSCPIVVKLESLNPGGSSKDRPALTMIETAEAEGALKPGDTIVEPTSGNTGVGLAIVAAQRGYNCIFVVTDKVGKEKVDLLRAYGAEVVVCPVAVAPEDPRSYYSTAERIVQETPNAYRPNQYYNPNNPRSHYETTGPEIWEQTKGRVTHFVAGAGTGGTTSGAGRYLKEMNPNICVVVGDPENSLYSGGSGRPYLVEGVGEDFWPDTYDPEIVDLVIPISDAQSFAMAHRITQQEGLLIGGSGGTAIAAACELAKDLTEEDLVVVVIPDSGRGYLSTVFNSQWMTAMGFSAEEGVTVSDLLENRDTDLPDLVYLQPTQSVQEALTTMEQHNVSQVPVAKGEIPIAAAEVVGSISKSWIEAQAHKGNDFLDTSLEDAMEPAFPAVGIGTPLDLLMEIFEESPALMVFDDGRPKTVITHADIVENLSAEGA